jgi:vacuolar protein sorting-associated protein 54
MIRDVEYFKTKIGGLDGAGDAGDYIVKLVKDKKVTKPRMATPPPAENGKKDTLASGKEIGSNGTEKTNESTNEAKA